MFKSIYLKKEDVMKKYWFLGVLYRRYKVFEETREGGKDFFDGERGVFRGKREDFEGFPR